MREVISNLRPLALVNCSLKLICTGQHNAAANADLVISLGSTLSVYPAASFPLMAAERGAPYVIINKGKTDHDGYADLALRLEGDVTQIFPLSVEEALKPVQ